MKTFTAHLRTDRSPVLVKESFAWGAFLFGPIWLLWHLAWIAALVSAVLLALTLFAPPPLRPVLSFALLLLLGLTGRDFVRSSLRWRGYQFVHVVAGRSPDDAFLRLLDHLPALVSGRPAAS